MTLLQRVVSPAERSWKSSRDAMGLYFSRILSPSSMETAGFSAQLIMASTS